MSVSMSWGGSEFKGENSYDSDLLSSHTGVTFVASSGDSGAPAAWPAVSPNVLSVGGTTLNLSGSTYSSETGWSDSGGGPSAYEAQPSYQKGVVSRDHGARHVPTSPTMPTRDTGVAVYDSVPYEGTTSVG